METYGKEGEPLGVNTYKSLGIVSIVSRKETTPLTVLDCFGIWYL